MGSIQHLNDPTFWAVPKHERLLTRMRERESYFIEVVQSALSWVVYGPNYKKWLTSLKTEKIQPTRSLPRYGVSYGLFNWPRFPSLHINLLMHDRLYGIRLYRILFVNRLCRSFVCGVRKVICFLLEQSIRTGIKPDSGEGSTALLSLCCRHKLPMEIQCDPAERFNWIDSIIYTSNTRP